MGLLGKQNRESNSHCSQTVIAEGGYIEGQLKLTCNIQIDGQIKGSIETDRSVTISATGSVDGSIRAERLIINGRFLGKVYTKSLEILEHGYLEGEVSATEFTIQKGGVFLGNSKNVSTEEVVNLDAAKKTSKPKVKTEQGKVEQCA
ncbi:polymer-forming cytoskeletal family protein [Vibrio coralliilyticus]|uniref:bactofilin family protein n=1 Tax=Vibrio coralliilyticus TaxID=190893 RepID=UPI00117C4F60|nr:polymer-forming cytoskeletal protein [Vibrio coralliilyticus]NOI57084.1 polymer-forming cytoskeletal family protein [Vibrio coralliilyticus]NOI78536.1 polymer-forming cytoskeletal family protein [Vibrio coralliilyticus]NRF26795.1 polymer-forming cytoskeletal protein [Vibrio coralliilyticus]NRF81065.1 polymer-forming cytoskeletal protein [Vibrio coralliilyticus]